MLKHISLFVSSTMHLCDLAAVIWLIYLRYGVKHYSIDQSINLCDFSRIWRLRLLQKKNEYPIKFSISLSTYENCLCRLIQAKFVRFFFNIIGQFLAQNRSRAIEEAKDVLTLNLCQLLIFLVNCIRKFFKKNFYLHIIVWNNFTYNSFNTITNHCLNNLIDIQVREISLRKLTSFENYVRCTKFSWSNLSRTKPNSTYVS